MDFDATVQADIWLPGLMPPSPPAQTVTGISVFPAIGLSGWTGFQTASGGLTPGAGSSGLPGLTLPPFLVIAGARVVISIQYFLEFYLTEGGFATFDAASRSGLGLNVPYVLTIPPFALLEGWDNLKKPVQDFETNHRPEYNRTIFIFRGVS